MFAIAKKPAHMPIPVWSDTGGNWMSKTSHSSVGIEDRKLKSLKT
jgi:hypothetical protein